MRRSSQIALIILAVVLLGGGWAAYYAQDKGFTHHWRNVVTGEFAKRGMHATIRRLTLDPFRGLIAKDVLIYEDPEHQNLLMRISQIALDLDLSEVRQREFSLRAFEIRNATITVPLDPARRLRGEKLVLEDFSARVLMPPDQIEIVRAEATIHGLAVTLSGSLFRSPSSPPRGTSAPTPASLGPAPTDHLSEMRRRRELIARFLAPLAEIRYGEGSNPKLELQVQGDASNLEGARLGGTLRCGPFSYRTYEATSLSATLRHERDAIVVRELAISDQQGKFQGELEVDLPRRDLRFQLSCTADAMGFLKTLNLPSQLNELVFYQPPLIEASGTYHLGRPFSWDNLPMEVIGRIRAERTTSRGVIFEAISGSFSANGPSLYLRNGKLEHKSGVMTCDWLKDEDGVRFKGDLRLHPTIFAPFVSAEGPRQFLKQWTLSDQSAVYIQVEGHGASPSPETWVTTGVVDLRNCWLNQHLFDQLQCDLYFDGTIHNFYNVSIRRSEGEITGRHIRFDHDEQTCTFHNVRGQVFPDHAVAWFAPDIARNLVAWDFDTPPQLSVEGMLDFRPPSGFARTPPRHDYSISFQSDSTARHQLFGREIELLRPSGAITIQGDTVNLRQFRAEALQGKVSADVSIRHIHATPAYEVQVQADSIDFQSLVRAFGGSRETSGEMSARADFHWESPGIEHLRGHGSAHLENANLFCMPTLGVFEKALATVQPLLPEDSSVARTADLRFRIAEGSFILDDLDAATAGFRLQGNGSVSLEDQSLDLAATVHVQEPADTLGLPLPPSLEFGGTGTLEAPVWKATKVARIDPTMVEPLPEPAAAALEKIRQLFTKPPVAPAPGNTDPPSASPPLLPAPPDGSGKSPD